MKDGDAVRKAVKVGGLKKASSGALAVSEERLKRQVALGRVLAPLVHPALVRQGVLLAQIVPHWRALCPLLAEHSCPESVRGDILTVAVASDGVKQELHYITPQIVEGITRLLGYEAITRVRGITRHDVRTDKGKGYGGRDYRALAAAAVPKAVGDKAKSLCESVRDDDLRQALAGLGSQILNDKSKK